MENRTMQGAYLYQVPSEQQSAKYFAATLARFFSQNPTNADISRITEERHPQIRWLKPEKRLYKKSDLETLFQELQQQQSSLLLIVIPHAELLQAGTANSLLKTLEEPPKNIVFVLITCNELRLLATIRSRLIRQPTIALPTTPIETHPLVQFFTTYPLGNQKQLQKILSEETPDDIISAELLDQIIVFWNQKPTTPAQQGLQAKYLKALLFFSHKLPMPGSSKIFWRALYMSLFIALEDIS